MYNITIEILKLMKIIKKFLFKYQKYHYIQINFTY